MNVNTVLNRRSSNKLNWGELIFTESGTEGLTGKGKDLLEEIYPQDWNLRYVKFSGRKPETWSIIYGYVNQAKLSSESEWIEGVEPTNFTAAVVSVSASSPIRIVGDAQTKDFSEFYYFYDEKSIVRSNFIELIEECNDTSFEDGVENKYTEGLFNLINKFGKSAVQVIGSMIRKSEINDYISSLTLQWLGHINNEDVKFAILRLLMTELKSQMITIRYGALIGLENLGDKRAANRVKEFASNEQNNSLRYEMNTIAKSLAKA